MHKPQNPLRLLLELRISRLPRGPQHDRQRVQQVAVRSHIGSGASLGDLLGEEVLACAYPAKGKRPPQLVRGGHAGGHAVLPRGRKSPRSDRRHCNGHQQKR